MTKKDYELIASILRNAKTGNWQIEYTIDVFAKALEGYNPRFDRDKFLTACGIGNGECEYRLDGKDTDGTKWYQCKTHMELAPSPDAPCAGYVEHR